MIIKERIGAYAVIIKDNKIALVMKKNGGYKGKYDLPGGGNEHNETLTDTLKREVMEEIGCKVTNYELLNCYTFNLKWEMDDGYKEDLHHIGIIYKVELENYELSSIDELDTAYSKWIDIDSITEDMVTPFTWYSLKEINLK